MKIDCRFTAIFAVLISLLATDVYAVLPQRAWGASGGRPTTAAVRNTQAMVQEGMDNMSQADGFRVIKDPLLAENDNERMVAMAGREYFLLVDRSGSMNDADKDPRTHQATPGWTLWKSAQVALEGVFEATKGFDGNGKLDVCFFNGTNTFEHKEISTLQEARQMFSRGGPSGGTPLAGALEFMYQNHWRHLLNQGMPFTALVFTDGRPDDQNAVVEFFKKIVRDHRLTDGEREFLVAVSFVQMGDDRGATQFLQYLDDNLKPILGVDLIDTKKDNFIFGTDEYAGRRNVGPLALLWDALFD